tara:strand:+ start:147 stop:422 length:276 start_codon:yes stop_codon:yes gene_type:complete
MKTQQIITGFNAGGLIHFHKAGCRDLGQGQNRFWARDAESYTNITEAVTTFLDTGDEENPGWILDEMRFFPCTEATKEQIAEIASQIISEV